MPNAYNSTRWTGPQLDAIYPVGSIYMSVNATDPGTLFGGTWERISGKFLLAADETYEAGSTGGAASVTSGGTGITVAQMPSHTHNVGYYDSASNYVPQNSLNFKSFRRGSNVYSPYINGVLTDMGPSGYTSSHFNQSTGGSQAHTHTVATMPPYLSVYMWKRTA